MDMYNWDLVCAASCASINNKLKTTQDLLINTFSYTSENNSTINGEFASWQIVPGGSSQRINFIIPIKSGRLSTTIAGRKIEMAVDGICPKIAIELQFVGSDDLNKTQAQFNCQIVAQAKKDVFSVGRSIVILDDDINKIFPPDEKYLSEIFSALMAEMIMANKQQLQLVFSKLISLPQDKTGWLQSHTIQYSYYEPINGELGALAVLAILDCNPNPPNLADLSLQFDPALIRSSDSVGFAIAKWAFLKHVLLAGLPKIFKRIDSHHFKLAYVENDTVKIIDNKIIININNAHFVSLSGIYSVSLQRHNNRFKVSLNPVAAPLFNAEVNGRLELDIFPGNINVTTDYKECGLAENFFMRG